MDKKQIINQRQLAWLTASISTSGGMITLPNVLFRINEMNAWFCYLLPILYIFVTASFFSYLAKHFPGKHIFEISIVLLGRFGGTIVNLLLIFHFGMIVLRDISTVAKFSSTILLDNTPLEILIFLPCLLLLYFGKSSLEVVARVNDLFYPLFAISIVLMPLLLSNEVSLRFLEPILTFSPIQLISGSTLALGAAGDTFVIGAFMHTIFNANQVRSSMRHGMMLGILLLTIVTLMLVFVLGPKMPGNMLYPTYELVQMIHITDFLDRIDIFLLTIWFPTVICKIIAIYLALLIGIGSLVQERQYMMFNKPMALLIVISTTLSFRSTTELFAFANYSSPVIVLGYQPLVMVLLYVVARYHQHKDKHKHNGQGQTSQQMAVSKQDEGKASIAWSKRVTYRAWVLVGNGLMLTCILCIILGLLLSKYYPLVGYVSAVIYAICLVLMTLSTYMEVTRLKLKGSPKKHDKKAASAGHADTAGST